MLGLGLLFIVLIEEKHQLLLPVLLCLLACFCLLLNLSMHSVFSWELPRADAWYSVLLFCSAYLTAIPHAFSFSSYLCSFCYYCSLARSLLCSTLNNVCAVCRVPDDAEMLRGNPNDTGVRGVWANYPAGDEPTAHDLSCTTSRMRALLCVRLYHAITPQECRSC